MKTKLVIVSAAVLAFATLPSCTGGIDPGLAALAAELGDGYLKYEGYRAEERADTYERFQEAREAKRQAAPAAMMPAPVPFMTPPPMVHPYMPPAPMPPPYGASPFSVPIRY